MDLGELRCVADERCARWEQIAASYEVIDGLVTNKSAAWLVLKRNDRLGQPSLWVSGEAELEWGDAMRSGAPRHELD